MDETNAPGVTGIQTRKLRVKNLGCPSSQDQAHNRAQQGDAKRAGCFGHRWIFCASYLWGRRLESQSVKQINSHLSASAASGGYPENMREKTSKVSKTSSARSARLAQQAQQGRGEEKPRGARAVRGSPRAVGQAREATSVVVVDATALWLKLG